MAPRGSQKVHKHERLHEVIYVMKGQVRVTQKEGSSEVEEVLKPGDMVTFLPGHYHNVCNMLDKQSITLAIKFVPDEGITGDEFQELLKQDWHGYLNGCGE